MKLSSPRDMEQAAGLCCRQSPLRGAIGGLILCAALVGAVFLLRTLLGSGFVPPPATGMFADVPISNPFAKWIEELAHRNITGGCGFNIYCPGNSNTRGEMAAFITRTFGLP